MIAKKNRKVDLERKRFAFFQIGLIVSGSLCLAAFEYSSVHVDKKVAQRMDDQQTIIGTENVFEELYTQPKQQERSNTIRLDEDLVIVDKDVKDGKSTKFTNDIIVIGAGEGEGDLGDFNYVLPDEPIEDFAQIEPTFPGGLNAMANFINKNIDIPEYIKEMGADGIVFVGFVVNKDGSIEQVKIQGSLSPEIDAAAVKVVSKMPRWSPGINAGKPVRVRFTLPIKIKYQ